MSAALDRERMQQALVLARDSIGLSDPNPRVGCVIGRDDGTVLGTGHTQRAGEAHAEVMALRDAKANGADVRGSTAWVTLEPCAHHGRTGPCCEALIDAGIGRVVVATHDPFRDVNGKGIARLRAAGIRVDMSEQTLAARAVELNIGFFSRIIRGRPWVRLKAAASLDGRTALPNGRSQWITSEAARRDNQGWRARAGAIVTGIGTVLADNPRMDVRDVAVAHPPWRVVLDSQWRTPGASRLMGTPGPVLVVGVQDDVPAARRLRDAGAECLALGNQDGRVDLAKLVGELARRQINEVHLEAGATLNGGFIEAGLVDEWLLYLAPKLLGAGSGIAALTGMDSLDGAPEIELIHIDPVGPDLRLRGIAPPGRADWPPAWVSMILTLGADLSANQP